MDKKYISEISNRSPRPRSKRLREQGIGGMLKGNTVVTAGASGEYHTHSNKTALDQISTDEDGYLYLTQTYEEDGDEVSVIEKVKAGYADNSNHAALADLAKDLTEDSPTARLIRGILGNFIPMTKTGNSVSDTTWAAIDMGTPLFAVKSLKGFYSEEFLSARGLNPNGGSGSAFNLMRSWDASENGNANTQSALGANLGWELKQRIDNLPTTSVNPYALTIQKNGTTLGTYDGSSAQTINIPDVASASALSTHTGNGTIHITANERTLWNQTASNLSDILGADGDGTLNKWNEIVAFLATYTEADTLANLLGNKADKSQLADYLPLSGGTITANIFNPLAINGTGTMPDVEITFEHKGEIKGGVGYNNVDYEAGMMLFHWESSCCLGIKDDGTPHYNGNELIHTLNYSTILDTRYVKKSGDTMTGLLTLNAGAKVISGQKLTIGDCEISWDASDGMLKFSKGIYSLGAVSARGANSAGGGSGGGLIQNVYGSASLGGAFSDSTLTDTFNAYTINKIYTELDGRLKNVYGATTIDSMLANYYTKSEVDAKNFIKDAGDGRSLKFNYSTAALGYDAFTWVAVWNGNTLQSVNKSVFASASSLSNYLPKSGGSISGTLSLGGRLSVNDDVYISGDIFINNKDVVWHSGNDGAGSGLDADLLDGYHRNNLFLGTNEWIASTSNLQQSIEVGGDANTYYPVIISVSDSKTLPTKISVYKNLGSKTPASYPGNHSTNNTSSLWLLYEGRNTRWDGNNGFFRLQYKPMPYATLCAKAESNTNVHGGLIVWLRGGGCQYYVACTNQFAVTVALSEYTLGTSGNNVYKVAPTTTVGNGGVIGEGLPTYGVATSASKLATTRYLWGQPFNGEGNVNGTFFYNNGDGTLKIYGVKSPDANNNGLESVAIQTCFDQQDPETSAYTASYSARCALLLQPRGGRVGILNPNPSYTLDVNGVIRSNNEIISTTFNAFRAVYGNYGWIIHNNGSNTHFLLTNSGDQYGTYNSLRPFNINNSTGRVTMSQGLTVNEITIGSCTIKYENGGLHFSSGIYSDGFVSARGANSSGGGGGTAFSRLDSWGAYSEDTKLYALGAQLGWDLYQNKADKSWVEAKGYLTSLDYINVKDVRNESRGPNYFGDRRLTAWFNNTGTPDSNWWSGIHVKGWTGAYAAWEIAATATTSASIQNLCFRTGINDTWNAWQIILTSNNYSSFLSYLPKSGGTLTGGLYVATGVGINDATGNGLLVYKPTSWTGVSNAQWGVGAIDIQGVIRSSNTSLLHYRNGVGNATIWDSGNDGAGSGLDADLLDGVHNGSLTANLINRRAIPNGGTAMQWFAGQIAMGTADGNAYKGSSNNFKLWSFPDGGTATDATYANIMDLRLHWADTYWSDIFMSPNTQRVFYRTVANNSANAWREFAFKNDNVASATKLYCTTPTTVGVTVATAKTNMLNAVKGAAFGNVAQVGASLINNWSNDSFVTVDSSAYAVINVTPQYNGDSYGQYLLFNYASINPKLIGRNNGAWTAMKTFAFLDDNVASASKLANTRYLWGQSFNGEGNVTGGLSNVGTISPSADNSYNLGSSSVGFKYGYMRWVGAPTSATFALGANNATHITIGTDGNVGFGITSPAYRVDILGNQRISSSISAGGGDVSLELWRGTNASWRFLNTGGKLKLQCNYTTAKLDSYFDCLTMDYNTGNALFKEDLRVKNKLIVSPYTNYDDTTAVGDTYAGISMVSDSAKIFVKFATVNGNIQIRFANCKKGNDGLAILQYNTTDTTNDMTLAGVNNFSATSTAFKSKSATTSDYFTRDTYAGSSWNNGYGAYNVAITDNSAQTPLMVAYRAGQTPSVTGANRLFAVELHNQGAQLRFCFGGADKYYFRNDGVLHTVGGVWSDGYMSARGDNTSDIRLKTDVKDFNATDIIKALRPVAFKWNALAKSKFEVFRTDEVQYGLIAQETEKVAPWLVDRNMFGDGLWGVKYEKLIPILTQGVKEVAFTVDDLLVRVKKLEKSNKRLEDENVELKRKIEILERR